MHPMHIVDGHMQRLWVRSNHEHQRKVRLVERVKLIILHRQRDYEETIGPVAAYELAKIINPLFRVTDVEGDWIRLADTKRCKLTT
jgi:hypothetical protein